MSEMNNVDNSFRTKLYNWRMANNLNQREAAVSLGCQQNQIWRWEQGIQNPRKATLAKLLPIIESVPSPAQEPEEEPWVPGVTAPDNEDIDHVYTARPKTFRERMEQRYGSMEEYHRIMNERVAEREEIEEEQEDPVELVAELPIEEPKAKPTPSLVKLTKVIGFLECLSLYASEGVAEPLEQQIKTLQDIAEEMSA